MVVSVNERSFTPEVLETSKTVLVDVWAPWCGLCRLIQPILQELQSEWSEPVKIVRVNADNNLKFANKYQIKSLPTLLLFENGELITRLEGFNGRDDLRMALKKLLVNELPKPAELVGKGIPSTSLENTTQKAA
ncbi:MAG TPA: thioredoxin [Cyanobacteria bacterium UBA8803]|nr:thioredoxin [Cyanobacteria bacterium UBA9273]HBL58178.1 thioredoxin [Cyanobacteria bacterium UBA8803]